MIDWFVLMIEKNDFNVTHTIQICISTPTANVKKYVYQWISWWGRRIFSFDAILLFSGRIQERDLMIKKFWSSKKFLKLYASYRSFDKRIELVNEKIAVTTSNSIIKNDVQKWFNNPRNHDSSISWLLILDSANDIHVMSDIWPYDEKNYLMLFTRQSTIVSIFVIFEIEIESLFFKNAVEMLLNLIEKKNELNVTLYAMQIAKTWKDLSNCMKLINIIVRNKNLFLIEFAIIQKIKKKTNIWWKNQCIISKNH